MNNYDTYYSIKRVYCLYRVSTLGQVEKDDIPMQKQRCREFAAAQGWSIVRELSEKGVSGFKVSARDRDAIQEIQRDAVDGKFDILLVFMFDRLGRRDDETPFVVEWFVRNGIEVWSATEGQQRFDNHVDKLMNYIRYWQASGESIKTSIRVKTRLSQMTEAGLYTGGTVPFGYHLEKRGRVNKRNREVCDLAIDEDEAEIVRLIFRKYVDEGYGAQRLCKYLHESGIHSRDGKGFPNTTINRIIKNVMYTGIIKNGDSRSAYLEELRIIDDATFDRAQQIMRERTMPRSSVPRNCKGSSLLVGNIFCAHCGNRLTLTTSGRKKNRNVPMAKYIRYQCHYNVRHPGECDGQSGYSVPKVDSMVEQVVRMKLAEIAAAPEAEVIGRQREREIELARIRLEQAEDEIDGIVKELDDYRAETIKVIRGESPLNAQLLNSLMSDAADRLRAAQAREEEAQASLDDLLASAQSIRDEYDKLLSWADLYSKSSFEARKMILSQLIDSVYVGRDYKMEINFKFSFDEFNTQPLPFYSLQENAGA